MHVILGSIFRQKARLLRTYHSQEYISIYSTVGLSIASIYNLGGIFTSTPVVVYIGYGLPYRNIY